jgi:hypothetical protein
MRMVAYAVTLPESEEIRIVPPNNGYFVLGGFKLICQSDDLTIVRGNPTAPIVLTNTSLVADVYAKLTFNIGSISNMDMVDRWVMYKWTVNIPDTIVFSTDGFVGIGPVVKSTNITSVVTIVKLSVGQSINVRPTVVNRCSTDEINITGAHVTIEQL